MRDRNDPTRSDDGQDWLPPEERLRLAAQAARIGIWEWDLATGQVDYSPIAREIAGFDPDETITVDLVRGLIHPDDDAANKQLARRVTDPAVREAPIYRFRLYRRSDGAERWMLSYAEAIFCDTAAGPEPVRYVGTIQDITDQVRTEQQLKLSEERLRMAVEAGKLAVWEVDLEREVVTPSPALNRMCGFPEEACPTLEEFRARYAPGERERMQALGREAMARGENRLSAEFRHLWPDGTERWLALEALILRRKENEALHAVGVLGDVTQRKRHELQLETAAQEMRHRVKNLITVIGAIASQSLSRSQDLDATRDTFLSRLRALAAATDLILGNPEEDHDLRTVIHAATEAFGNRPEAIRLSGDAARIPAETVRSLALALHELSTNAVKYGALSGDAGEVTLDWNLHDGLLHLTWRESGGPPVTRPARTGFGTQLLTSGLFSAPEELRLDYAPDGLVCRIVLQAA